MREIKHLRMQNKLMTSFHNTHVKDIKLTICAKTQPALRDGDFTLPVVKPEWADCCVLVDFCDVAGPQAELRTAWAVESIAEVAQSLRESRFPLALGSGLSLPDFEASECLPLLELNLRNRQPVQLLWLARLPG